MSSDVLVFACNWSGWSCVETASSLGFHRPPVAKVVKVSCLSRLHAGLMLKAFELGAAGVMLLGCEPGRCHFGTDANCTTNEYEKARNILETLGIEKGRLVLLQLAPYSGQEFVKELTKLVETTAKTVVG